jgi:hypothetical protein
VQKGYVKLATHCKKGYVKLATQCKKLHVKLATWHKKDMLNWLHSAKKGYVKLATWCNIPKDHNTLPNIINDTQSNIKQK